MPNIDMQYGDGLELVKNIPDNSIDLIVTSPPYADMVSYGKNVNTLNPDNYADWFLPFAREWHRILKPTGSFILNINDKINDGERSIYVFDLVCRIKRETDWKFRERMLWHKKSGLPTSAPKRLNDRLEYLFHWVKDTKNFKANMDAIRVPYAPSSLPRYKTAMHYQKIVNEETGISALNDKMRGPNPLGTIPENVFRFSTSAAIRKGGKLHPAAYHPELPAYFIKWLTDENDLVCDPFGGSFTTALAALELNRNFVGFELNESYKEIVDERLKIYVK